MSASEGEEGDPDNISLGADAKCRETANKNKVLNLRQAAGSPTDNEIKDGWRRFWDSRSIVKGRLVSTETSHNDRVA